MSYKCIVYSNHSLGREYEVTTTSAIKAARLYGRCELGETVDIRRKRTHELLSRAVWHPALKRYIQVTV